MDDKSIKKAVITVSLSLLTITPIAKELIEPKRPEISKEESTYLYDETLEGIKKFEGFREKTYICPGGKLTIGYGYTVGVYTGQQITEKEAAVHLEDHFKKCLAIAEADGLTGNQSLAIASFIYNLGSGAYKKSTLRKFILSDESIDSKILEYRMSKGKVLRGLEKRRAWELKLFNTI